jgi:hypothetical protein
MAISNHSIASKDWELAKYVVTLPALGLFAKLLQIDLSKLQIFGVSLGGANDSLIPGFLGLGLIYVFVAFNLARFEGALTDYADKGVHETQQKLTSVKSVKTLMKIIAPLGYFVYSMPVVLGAVSIVLLSKDVWIVVKAIWALAFT